MNGLCRCGAQIDELQPGSFVHLLHLQHHTNQLLEALVSTVQDLQSAAQQLINNTSRLVVQEDAEQTVPAGSVAVAQSDLDALGEKLSAANDHVASLLDPSNPATVQGSATPPAPPAEATAPVADTVPDGPVAVPGADPLPESPDAAAAPADPAPAADPAPPETAPPA